MWKWGRLEGCMVKSRDGKCPRGQVSSGGSGSRCPRLEGTGLNRERRVRCFIVGMLILRCLFHIKEELLNKQLNLHSSGGQDKSLRLETWIWVFSLWIVLEAGSLQSITWEPIWIDTEKARGKAPAALLVWRLGILNLYSTAMYWGLSAQMRGKWERGWEGGDSQIRYEERQLSGVFKKSREEHSSRRKKWPALLGYWQVVLATVGAEIEPLASRTETVGDLDRRCFQEVGLGGENPTEASFAEGWTEKWDLKMR